MDQGQSICTCFSLQSAIKLSKCSISTTKKLFLNILNWQLINDSFFFFLIFCMHVFIYLELELLLHFILNVINTDHVFIMHILSFIPNNKLNIKQKIQGIFCLFAQTFSDHHEHSLWTWKLFAHSNFHNPTSLYILLYNNLTSENQSTPKTLWDW